MAELLEAAEELLANWDKGNLSPFIQRLAEETERERKRRTRSESWTTRRQPTDDRE